jgi:imidazolonepropionase-like amidohydrolase
VISRTEERFVKAYRADRAFDGDRVLPDGALVLVEGDTIAGVEPASAHVPDGCEVTYLPGTTLLPGLIDVHVHLCANGGPDALDRIPGLLPAELDGVITAALEAQLAAGVTTVRDLGDHRFAVVARRLPNVVAAGPPITSVRGHCWSMGGEASGEDELRRAVRERAERGADLVKIMTSGGAMTVTTDVTAEQFTPDELRAVVDEAHRHGLPVAAHAHAQTAVRHCIEAGVDDIEHCTCIVPGGVAAPADMIAALVAAGTVVCPTLGRRRGLTELPAQLRAMMARTGMTLEARRALIGELVRAGVALISGSDAGINPGKPHGVLPEAVIDLVGCGMPAPQALASATGAAANACRIADRTGRLRAGLAADLLLVGGDPAHDVTALREVRMVVSRGDVLSGAA